MSDARAHAGIGFEESVHAVLVTRQDDHELVAVVLHDLEQDIDAFLTVILGIGRTVQVIRLVDEQDAAHGAIQDTLGLRRGLPMNSPTRSSRMAWTRCPDSR
jgi:hypothetical protein